MTDLRDDEERQILGEVLHDKLTAIHEMLEGMTDMPPRLKNVEERLISTEADVKTIKSAVRELTEHAGVQDYRLDDHDERITSLEAV